MTTRSTEPKRVRLVKDFIDFKVGMAYPAGTILIRSQSGQYITEGTKLGEPCVAGFFLIRDLCEEVGAGNVEAYCPDCNWRGEAGDCDTDTEQESWGMEPYGIACCPKCNEWNVEFIPNERGES